MREERDESVDTTIRIEFEESRSKYFEDALDAAGRAADAPDTRFVYSPRNSSRDRYKFITSNPLDAKQVWELVRNWKSSGMEIESDLLDYPRRDADEEGLRELQYSLRREDVVESIDFGASDPIIEVRFGPSTSKYMQKAVGKASHYAHQHEKSEYEKLFWGEDNEDTGHLFVTRDAAAADKVWDIVENWKNAELRIDGEFATESELESLKRSQVPGCVWVLVIILMLLAIFFQVVLNT